MNAKGISDIISGILILLIVVALAGAFLLFSSGTFTNLSETGTENTQDFGQTTQTAVSVDALSCGATTSLTIRNTGAVAFTPSTQVTVYKNEIPVTGVTWNTGAGSLAPNNVTTRNVGGLVTVAGDTLRVAVQGGGTGSSSRCP